MFELADSLLGVYKVDNMSYSIHFGVRRLVNEMKAKHVKENDRVDSNTNEKGDANNAKVSNGFPDINVSAIPNAEEADRSQNTTAPENGIQEDISEATEGDTVIEANGTLIQNGTQSPLSHVAAADPLHDISNADSNDLFEDMNMNEDNEPAPISVGQRGPLAASTPFGPPRRELAGGFLRASLESKTHGSEDSVSQDATTNGNEEPDPMDVSINSSEASFKSAQTSQEHQSSTDEDSGNEIGPTP